MEQNTFDMGRLMATVGRHRWLFIISVAVCLGLSLLYLYRTPKTYAVSAQVLVSDEDGGGSSMLKTLALGTGGASVEDEVLVMDAHQLLAQAVEELGLNKTYITNVNIIKKRDLYGVSPLKVMAPKSLLDTLSETLIFKIDVNDKGDEVDVKVKRGRFKTLAEGHATHLPMTIRTPYGLFAIDTTKYYKPGKDVYVCAFVSSPDATAQGITELVVSRSSKKSNGISLEWEDNVPERGADLLDKMIEIYNRWSQAKKDETARNTARFIDERLEYIYRELSSSEADIQNFKQAQGITEPQVEVPLKLQRQSQIDAQLTNLQTQNEVFQMIRQFVSDPKTRYEPIPFLEGANDAALEEYNGLILRRMTLLKTAKPGNVALQTLDTQIDAMRQNVIATIDRVIASNSMRMRQAASKNSQERGTLTRYPSQERHYRELMRQQTVKNTLYSFLLEKREENQLLLAASLPKGQIIDRAYVHNKPVAPKTPMVIFLGLVLGLILPAMYLYLKGLLNNKFDNPDELSRLTSVPIAGEMAHSRRAATQGLVIQGNSTDPVAELFRLIRSNMDFMLPATEPGQGSVIAVTSSVGGEGKSFIAANLAETLALAGKRVVLVGYDIRKPMLARYLDLKAEPGITNYLSNPDVTIQQLIQRKADFDVIVAGPIPPNPAELLLSQRAADSIATLRQMYDIVLLDTAPMGMVSDSAALTKYADLTLYVTRARYTLKSHIAMLNKYVADKRLRHVALVVNDVHLDRNSGYGYGYNLDEPSDK